MAQIFVNSRSLKSSDLPDPIFKIQPVSDPKCFSFLQF